MAKYRGEWKERYEQRYTAFKKRVDEDKRSFHCERHIKLKSLNDFILGRRST